jgi:hypothetical protein
LTSLGQDLDRDQGGIVSILLALSRRADLLKVLTASRRRRCPAAISRAAVMLAGQPLPWAGRMSKEA